MATRGTRGPVRHFSLCHSHTAHRHSQTHAHAPLPVSLGNLQLRASQPHGSMYPSHKKKKVWREEKGNGPWNPGGPGGAGAGGRPSVSQAARARCAVESLRLSPSLAPSLLQNRSRSPHTRAPGLGPHDPGPAARIPGWPASPASGIPAGTRPARPAASSSCSSAASSRRSARCRFPHAPRLAWGPRRPALTFATCNSPGSARSRLFQDTFFSPFLLLAGECGRAILSLSLPPVFHPPSLKLLQQ